jgi:hypothetical protein
MDRLSLDLHRRMSDRLKYLQIGQTWIGSSDGLDPFHGKPDRFLQLEEIAHRFHHIDRTCLTF